MKANAASRLLNWLMFGTACLSSTVWAQENAPLTHAVVNTLADSIIGGAAGLSVDKMGVLFAGTFDERLYRVRMDGSAEVLADGLYGATGNVIGPLGNLYQLSFFGGYITMHDRSPRQSAGFGYWD